MIYILTKSRSEVRRHEQREEAKFKTVEQQKADNARQGLNNPIVTDTDYETPVSKKECLQMMDKMEAQTEDKERKKAVQNMYLDTKKHGE